MISGQDLIFETERNIRRAKLLIYRVQEHQIEEVWKRFENAGFKPLLIKGWAAAQCYSEPSERMFNDVDLVVAPEEYIRAQKFVDSLSDKTAIDLHEGLRNLDTLPFEDLYKRSQIIECGKTPVRILCPEDHLRVLCVHWLIDGGAKKDKLWDIYYAVKNRPIDFDWDRCLNSVSKTRQRWIVCAVGLAHKYLDLNVSDTPFAENAGNIPKWLIEALEKEWSSDTFIIPIHFVLKDRKVLWQQIKKRIPPNPIQATVEMEGEFDDSSRIYYQIGDVFWRLTPLFKRIVNRLKTKSTNYSEYKT